MLQMSGSVRLTADKLQQTWTMWRSTPKTFCSNASVIEFFGQPYDKAMERPSYSIGD